MKNNKRYDMIVPDDKIRHSIVTSVITKMTDFQCALLHETAHLIVNMIDSALRHGQTLFDMCALKGLVNQMMSICCDGIYTTICNDKTDDPDFCLQLMMDLIMIIIRRHGDAISAKLLDQLLYNCGNDGIYKLAITRLIDFGMVKRVAQNDGKAICFYISND